MATEAETVQTKGCYPNFLPWFTQQRATECLHRLTNFPCGDVMPAQREKVPGRVPRDGTNCLNYNEERNHATCGFGSLSHLPHSSADSSNIPSKCDPSPQLRTSCMESTQPESVWGQRCNRKAWTYLPCRCLGTTWQPCLDFYPLQISPHTGRKMTAAAHTKKAL